MNTKVLFYSTGNHIHYPVTNHNGEECLLIPTFHSITPPHLHLGNHKSLLYVCHSLAVSETDSFLSYFRFLTLVISYGICLSF